MARQRTHLGNVCEGKARIQKGALCVSTHLGTSGAGVRAPHSLGCLAVMVTLRVSG